MGGFFQADLAVLEGAVTQLRASEDVLRQSQRALTGDAGRQLGPAVLGKAADEFQKAWQFGTGRIAESAALTAQGLEGCVRVYREIEDELRDGLNALGEYVPADTAADTGLGEGGR
ncbi:hypothetical protein [Tomitella biformata]|uniref:hypothetical protein n=1 Tax=Tomitella biformata TaxID=630403 RepID=UPI0011DCA8CB|nr:hypothetical protein [Tomitella biformata]